MSEGDFNRERAFAILYILAGLGVIFLANLTVEAGALSTFTDFWVGKNAYQFQLPSRLTLYILGTFCISLGGWGFWRGFRAPGAVLVLVGALLVASFLVWITQGKSLNLPSILQGMLSSATPLTLGALTGVLCERAAVINIAIEGMMLFGAFAAVAGFAVTGNPWIGLLSAMGIGGVIATLHAVLSIKYKVDQIISGTAINILAYAATRYLKITLLGPAGLRTPGTIGSIRIPYLADIPVLGPLIFDNQPTVYIMLILVVAVNWILFHTPWGLRTRSVGEHPRAADTVGINVFRVRYFNVILGGLIAGIGGAYFSIGEVGAFEDGMTGGKGFVALAAMIFGKWTPIGGFLASLLFGFADAVQVKMQILKVPIPPEFLLMTPYLMTIIILAGVVGRAIPPAADGKPYEKQ
ncbi:MAG: ABC transporter permease [Anaerolineae bacterium]